MKTQSILGLLSFALIQSLVGQESFPKTNKSWADYYYMNGEYEKAIDAYKNQEDLSLSQQRYLGKSFLEIGKREEAQEAYTPVANSPQAEVEDYYTYANLLINNKRLSTEYREKAYRLPWNSPSLFDNDSLLFKKRFNSSDYKMNNLKGNDENNAYGLIFLNNINPTDVFYLGDQELEKKETRVLKRIESTVPIYNFFNAKIDTLDFSIQYTGELPSSVNSFFQEGPGSYHLDSDYFYFTRSVNEFDANKKLQLNSYRIKRNKIQSNNIAESLPYNLPNYSSLHPSLSPSGKRLYFASDRPGGFGGMDIYYVLVDGNQFSKPINLGPDINTSADEVFPFSFSETELFFSSNKQEAKGNLDVFLAIHRIEKRWEVFLLGEGINTEQDDFSFGLNKKLSVGYFSSNRKGGKGGDDLYAFKYNPSLRGEEDFYNFIPSDTLVLAFQGVLANDLPPLNDADPLQRLIPKQVVEAIPPQFGSYKLNKNGSFWYKNTNPLEAKDSFAYRLKTEKKLSDLVWVYLSRNEVAKEKINKELQMVFAPIFYSIDESKIQVQYRGRAEKVVQMMRQYPNLEIEIVSFTDCRGGTQYNIELSKRRTQTILDYVRPRIDNPERIYGTGKGEIIKTKDYQLVVGSYSDSKNVYTMQKKLESLGVQVKLENKNQVTRVIVKEADVLLPLKELQAMLFENEIGSWINENPCIKADESIHQQHRRTDFNIIKL